MHRRGWLPIGTHGCRRARNLRQGVFKKVESFSSTEFGPFLYGIADHAHDERHHPDSNGDHHDGTHGHLRTHHGCGRRDHGRQRELVHVVDHRRGRHRPHRHGRHHLLSLAAQVQDDPKADRPAQPGQPRKPGGHDGHPRLQHAAFEENRFDKATGTMTSTNLFVNRIIGDHDAGHDAHHERPDAADHLVRRASNCAVGDAGGRHDGVHAVRHANRVLLPHAVNDVHLFATRFGIGRPHCRRFGDGASDTRPQTPQPFNAAQKGRIEFENVCFRYPGAEEDVLHDISFTANPGQTTAFIGATGSGKSTLVNLIPRFYDVTGGAICVDGVDIRQVAQHDLRAEIGYVPQKSVLFSGTIESNLRYADENAGPRR